MTLAFKWSHRYEGEGSLEYDQCIELLKCSLILFRLRPLARALIGLRSPPAVGSAPPGGPARPLRLPRRPCPGPWGASPCPRPAVPGALGRRAGCALGWGGCDHIRGWPRGVGGRGVRRARLSCPGGCGPAHARGQRQRKTCLSRAPWWGQGTSCTGCFVAWECRAEPQGSGEDVK